MSSRGLTERQQAVLVALAGTFESVEVVSLTQLCDITGMAVAQLGMLLTSLENKAMLSFAEHNVRQGSRFPNAATIREWKVELGADPVTTAHTQLVNRLVDENRSRLKTEPAREFLRDLISHQLMGTRPDHALRAQLGDATDASLVGNMARRIVQAYLQTEAEEENLEIASSSSRGLHQMLGSPKEPAGTTPRSITDLQRLGSENQKLWLEGLEPYRREDDDVSDATAFVSGDLKQETPAAIRRLIERWDESPKKVGDAIRFAEELEKLTSDLTSEVYGEADRDDDIPF
jgi:hypothetical protein